MKREEIEETFDVLIDDALMFGFWVTDKKGKRVDPLEYLRKTESCKEETSSDE
jgi:hypothetical protein